MATGSPDGAALGLTMPPAGRRMPANFGEKFVIGSLRLAGILRLKRIEPVLADRLMPSS